MPAVLYRKRNRKAIKETNMLPFIDVMLVLLVIFMITAPLVSPSTIDLPSVGQTPRQSASVLQIIIHKNNTLYLKQASQEQPVSLEGLGSAISAIQKTTSSSATAQINKASPVVISADKGVPYDRVVKVMDTLQQAGIQRIGLSVLHKP